MTGSILQEPIMGQRESVRLLLLLIFTTWMFNRISQWKSGYRKEDFEINDVYLVQLVQDNIDAVKLGKRAG
mgnify:CR=1 FL=1